MSFYDPNWQPEDKNLNALAEIVDVLDKTKEVKKAENEVVNSLVAANNKQELEKQIELFKINQSKKDALRVVKLDTMKDKVEDEVFRRIEKRPDQISNKELLDFYGAISKQLDDAKVGVVGKPDTNNITVVAPEISTAPAGDTYNINLGTDLPKESKDNVVDAIKGVIALLQNTNSPLDLTSEEPEEDVSIEVIEETDDTPDVGNLPQ